MYMSNQIKHVGREKMRTKGTTRKVGNVTSNKGGRGHTKRNMKKSVKKRKTQRGGWGGFVYGIGFGAILYKWFNIRSGALNDKE